MTKKYAILQLKKYYKLNGYVRIPVKKRLTDGWRKYKKGYELRIICQDVNELKKLRTIITSAGISLAKSYINNKRYIQPIYGYENYLLLNDN